MGNAEALIIKTVQEPTQQGMSQPFLCETENGSRYYVKGRRSGRESQINEWLCSNIARALGLPVADFAILQMPDYLYDELPAPYRSIGLGPCFGSLAVNDAAILEEGDVACIPYELQLKIAAFDWLVKNEDRQRANSNLLYHPHQKALTVIDHNLSFDKNFSSLSFLENHIFRQAFAGILEDLLSPAQWEDFLAPALSAYTKARHTLPQEWQWTNDEQDIPTNYDFDFAEQTLNRLNNGKLWNI